MNTTASGNGRPTDTELERGTSVLVTGAAGFIGSHLCDRLLEEGHRVWGLDNFDDAYDPARKRENLSGALDHPSMQLVEGDIRDRILLDGLIADVGFDAVVHLAAHSAVQTPAEPPKEMFDVNVLGTLTLLEVVRRHREPVLVVTSPAGDGENSKAGSWSRPLSPHTASSRAAEMLCHSYHCQHNLTIYSVRLPSVFGPRQPPGGPIYRLARLIADGKPVTLPGNCRGSSDYLFIEDALDGLQRAMSEALAPATRPGFRLVEFDRCDSQTPGAIVESLAEALGVEPNVEYDRTEPADEYRGRQSPGNTASRIRHECCYEFDDGLASFIKWFRADERRPLDSDTVVAR